MGQRQTERVADLACSIMKRRRRAISFAGAMASGDTGTPGLRADRPDGRKNKVTLLAGIACRLECLRAPGVPDGWVWGSLHSNLDLAHPGARPVPGCAPRCLRDPTRRWAAPPLGQRPTWAWLRTAPGFASRRSRGGLAPDSAPRCLRDPSRRWAAPPLGQRPHLGVASNRAWLRQPPVSLPTAPRAVSAIPVGGGPLPHSVNDDPPGRGFEPRLASPAAGLAPDSAPRCLRDPTRRWAAPPLGQRPTWAWLRTAPGFASRRSRSRQRPALSPRSHSEVGRSPTRSTTHLGVASNRAWLRQPPVSLPTAPCAVSAIPLGGSIHRLFPTKKRGPTAPFSWSGREDSNLRPSAPKADALPGCATPRWVQSSVTCR